MTHTKVKKDPMVPVIKGADKTSRIQWLLWEPAQICVKYVHWTSFTKIRRGVYWDNFTLDAQLFE